MRSSQFLVLAILTHCLSAIFPKLAADLMGSAGKLPAMVLFYAVGVSAQAFTLPFLREDRRALLCVVGKGAQKRGLLVLSLAGFSASGACFYLGMPFPFGKRTAEFVFLTRFDWIVQFLVTLALLREGCRVSQAVGVLVALGGAALISWQTLGEPALIGWACGYIAGATVGYTCSRLFLRETSPAEARAFLFVRSLGLLSVFLVLNRGIPAVETRELTGAMEAGLVLLVLFWSRIEALRGLALWRVSALSVIQPVVLTGVTWFYSGELPSGLSLAGVALIIAGTAAAAWIPPLTPGRPGA